jgi:hypothetical protein
MTESDDAETRKSILGDRSLETNAGAIARVLIPIGCGCHRGGVAYLLLSMALEQQLLPDT